MKRFLAICLALLLTGCSGAKKEINRGIALRSKLLSAQGCSFSVSVTADYGTELFSFRAACTGDNHGGLDFTVESPEEIEGITGRIADEKGKLTYDGMALAFPLLAEGMLNPVSAPWILLKTLRGGCITGAGEDGELLKLYVDDSYSDDALNLNIWLDAEDTPVRAEIGYAGRRYLSLEIENFQIL